LLLGVSELIKEEGWLEAESFPAVSSEAIDLALCVRDDDMVVKA